AFAGRSHCRPTGAVWTAHARLGRELRHLFSLGNAKHSWPTDQKRLNVLSWNRRSPARGDGRSRVSRVPRCEADFSPPRVARWETSSSRRSGILAATASVFRSGRFSRWISRRITPVAHDAVHEFRTLRGFGACEYGFGPPNHVSLRSSLLDRHWWPRIAGSR